MAGLIFDGTEQIGPNNAFRFKTPTGGNFYERDPLKAMQLGMPPDFLNQNAGPAPAPMPDQRLASNGPSPQQVEAALTGGAPQTDAGGPSFATQAELQQSVQGARLRPAVPVQAEPPSPQPNAQDELKGKIASAVPMPAMYTRSASKPAHWEDTTRKTSGLDPERAQALLKERDELDELAMTVQKNRGLAAVEAADAERMRAARDRIAAAIEIEHAKDFVDQQEAFKRSEYARLDEMEQTAAKRTPDSDRIFKRAGAGGRVMATVGSLLSDLGAALRGKDGGSAQKMLDDMRDRDVAEQEAEIAGDREAVAQGKNAFARMLADGKDPEFARAALKMQQTKYQEAVAREAAAAATSPLARQQFENLALQRGEEALKFRAELESKVNTESSQKFVPEKRGGATLNLKGMKDALEARNILGAAAAGTTLDAYGAGETAKAKTAGEAAAGGGAKIAQSTVSGLNEQVSNLRAWEQAEKDMEAIISSGKDVEMSPSGFRDIQPFTEFTQGAHAAEVDRYGEGGAAIKNVIGTGITSTRSPALGTLSESDKRNQIENFTGDGKPETIRRNFARKKKESQAAITNQMQALSPVEQRRVLEQADPETRKMILDALSGEREGTDLIDRQK